jgi:hypothetical protein
VLEQVGGVFLLRDRPDRPDGGRVSQWSVMDAAGAPVSRIRVALSLQGGSAGPFNTLTDKSGKFTFEGLAPATYDLRVEAPGFRLWERIGIQVGNENVEVPKIVLTVPGGCGVGGEARLTLIQRIRIRVKQFFVPTTDYTICQ